MPREHTEIAAWSLVACETDVRRVDLEPTMGVPVGVDDAHPHGAAAGRCFALDHQAVVADPRILNEGAWKT